MHQNSMVNNYSGRPDSFPPEDEHQYTSKKAEGQWRWERDAQQMSPQLYSDGQGGNAGRSFYPNQMQDTKMGSNQEQRVHPQEQDMEVGYEDNPVPQTLERLDQKFHSDIMKFTKEQGDAEDAETARHREKIIEINNQYQEKLSSLRAKYATLREELLQRESQARLQTYQLAGMTPYQNNSGPVDMNQGHHGPHGYGAPDMAPGEPHRQFGGRVEFDSYRERHESFGRGRIQGADTRVPTPGGRVYNTGPRYY
ncbi:uncharacterized protein LOC110710902 [Chenopodium quinoa]|uniref:uncharacterized protein LOC110710902 n=1 Tax=Chenopodium quinoa TaxID=63459 RepID=UPI000B77ED74|nr:uncharacterized protein LOC110710902 [Chenopodium quinoa]XP_021744945.1 uncharacterized protein LOC110710902 [Chenopodium quinoa]XP_021744948.1 uncharacterized protein LOC110710902 [Chenopodium quinoa]